MVNHRGNLVGIDLEINILLQIRERVGKLRVGVFLALVVPVLVFDIDFIRDFGTLHFHINRVVLILEGFQRIIRDDEGIGSRFLKFLRIMDNSLGRFSEKFLFYGEKQEKYSNRQEHPQRETLGLLNRDCLHKRISLKRVNLTVNSGRKQVIAHVVTTLHLLLQLKEIQ